MAGQGRFLPCVQVGLYLICLTLLGFAFGQQTPRTEEVKEAALETAQAIIQTPTYTFDNQSTKGETCDLQARQLYAEQPFLVRSLIHPTESDLQRLQQRVIAAHQEDPDFIGDTKEIIRAARIDNRDYYEVPIYHRTCGYLFHTRPRENENSPLVSKSFHPISAQKAQQLLGSTQPPTFISFFSSLTPRRDGYMWVTGSQAIDAFRENNRYRIVDRSGSPVSPLETRLTPLIFRESFVTSMGDPSAYWYFQLPVRLEPLR